MRINPISTLFPSLQQICSHTTKLYVFNVVSTGFPSIFLKTRKVLIFCKRRENRTYKSFYFHKPKFARFQKQHRTRLYHRKFYLLLRGENLFLGYNFYKKKILLNLKPWWCYFQLLTLSCPSVNTIDIDLKKYSYTGTPGCHYSSSTASIFFGWLGFWAL